MQYHPQIDRLDIKFITYFFGTEVLDLLEDENPAELFRQFVYAPRKCFYQFGIFRSFFRIQFPVYRQGFLMSIGLIVKGVGVVFGYQVKSFVLFESPIMIKNFMF